MAPLFEFINTVRQKNAQGLEAVGHSRGGLSTKIHAAVDALGNPVRLILTPGQASESRQATKLLEDFKPAYVLADKGYDGDEFIRAIEALGAVVVIPSKRNRRQPRIHDSHCYKDRNLVERFFQKVKQFRRIATRYERLARNYQSMLNLACSIIWLA